MRVAVIPARGGSKRIPRKNIRRFGGAPMISWSIRAACESECFDEVIVSTDDEEIADIARSYGATTPFVRPAELANDFAGTIPVVKHAVEWVNQNLGAVEYACCLYATAPFVDAGDLQRGLQLLDASDASFAFSVTTFAFPIQRALQLTDAGRVKMFSPEHFATRSQDLEEAYHDAGQFYWGRADAWLNEDFIFSERSIPVQIPRYRVQDIDTEEDWIRAEMMMKALKNEEVALV